MVKLLPFHRMLTDGRSFGRNAYLKKANDKYLDSFSLNITTVKLGYNELGYNELGYNELGYNDLGYNELGYNEHLVVTNTWL